MNARRKRRQQVLHLSLTDLVAQLEARPEVRSVHLDTWTILMADGSHTHFDVFGQPKTADEARYRLGLFLLDLERM